MTQSIAMLKQRESFSINLQGMQYSASLQHDLLH